MSSINKFIGLGVGAFILIFLIVSYAISGGSGEAFTSDYMTRLGYVLIIIAAVAILVGSILSLVADPKSALSSVGGIAFIGVLYGISYALTTGNDGTELDPATSHYVGAILVMTYLTLLIAILGMLYLMVSRLFR